MNKQQHKMIKLPVCLLGLIVFTLFCNAVAAQLGIKAQAKKPDTSAKVRLEESYGKLPLSFEANRGQTDKKVQFVSRGQGYGLFLTPTEAVLSLHKSEPAETKTGKSSARALPVPAGKTPQKSVQSGKDKAATLRMKLVGGNPNPHLQGLDQLPGKVNYFRGKDPKQWQTNVPTYAKTRYEKVYPGIDLIYYGNQRQLEYDFIVAPGADPKAVRLSFKGAEKVAVDAQGDLVLHTAGGDVRLRKPVAYQTVAGQRRGVDVRFALHDAPGPSDKNIQRQKKIKHPQIGFQLAAYDAKQTLVIDPVLSYSSYLGGTDHVYSSGEYGMSIAVDSAGNAYVTGSTSTSNFPTVYARYPNMGNWDAFVTKFDASGAQILYSTYLGGNGTDSGNGIAVDSAGNAYVTGQTYSTDFPTANAVYPNYSMGGGDAFVTKFDASGAQVLYSTYLGGNGPDSGNGIAVDRAWNAYVTGYAASLDFPAVNAVYPISPGTYSAFVTKFDASGAHVLYSTYLGGSREDYGNGIAVDSSGNAYVTGYTDSTDFPAVNAKYPNSGYVDAFVTKFSASGAQVVYSTYLGGSRWDHGNGIAADGSGNAYVTGWTDSTDFPAVNAKYPYNMGLTDAFVTKFDASGAQVLYSTYLGGNWNDSGNGIAVDNAGKAYVTGNASHNFPTINAVYPNLSSSSPDAFVTKFNASGAQVLYSTYLGGNYNDIGNGIAVDSAGNAYVTGQTFSSDFPTHASDPSIVSYDPDFNGETFAYEYDAFIAKISDFTDFPFLSFPLNCGNKDCTFHYSQGAYTPISINSVLDHQMDDPYINEDGVVAAFTGERGEGSAENQGCYPKVGGGSFSVIGLYKGTGDGCLADQGLNYDNHPGYDYRAGMGAPVKAAAGGKVVNILNTSTNTYDKCVPRGIPAGCAHWGYVGIDHGNGYVTQYGHLSQIDVNAEQTVVEGQQIGLSGDTGVPGSPHLHFEVLKEDKDKQYDYAFVDPYGWEGAPEIDYLAQINGIQNVRLWKYDPRECLFNWAEGNYPVLFAPSGSPTVISGGYTYRYYSATNTYLKVSSIDNHVYYTGADGILQDVGPLSDWLPKAGCQPPPPVDCLFNWAENNYPSLFAPSGALTASWDVYTYRYYSATNAYVGVSSTDNHVYYMGADGILQDEGPLPDWLPRAGCQ